MLVIEDETLIATNPRRHTLSGRSTAIEERVVNSQWLGTKLGTSQELYVKLG